MRFIFAVITALFLATPISTPAVAQDNPDLGKVIFKELEKQLIEKYFGNRATSYQSYDNGGSGEKGGSGKKGRKDKKGKKYKNKQMPPGLAKQLQRHSTLPPGLAKRDLPYDLARQLPPPPRGTRRYVVNNDVVLIQEATGLILDILRAGR